MKITLLFFGVAQDIAETRQLTFDLNYDATVLQLRQRLAERFAGMDESLAFAVAINEKLADDNQVIREGDVVAVLPPVSGG